MKPLFQHLTWIVALLICMSSVRAIQPPMNLRCEYESNPLGVDVIHPRLFWLIPPEHRGLQQSAFQIIASSSLTLLNQDNGDLWDSGKVNSSDTIQIPYSGTTPVSFETIYWKVRNWDEKGNMSDWSSPAQWTMGVLKKEDWKAHWITAAKPGFETLQLRREFTVRPGLKRALIVVCGLGQYVLTVNGRNASPYYLSPGWTDYQKTCLYDTMDLTPLLSEGTNTVGLLLGNGMYNVHGGRYTKFRGSYGPPQVIAQIRLEYDDQSVDEVCTDTNWRTASGPITFSSIYGGEDYDARQAQPGWDFTGFKDSSWMPAIQSPGPGGQLQGLSCSAPPLGLFETHRAVATTDLTNGDQTIDLGQNASHVLRLTVSGQAGSSVQMFPSELTNHDGFASQSSMGGGHRGPIFCQYTKGTDGTETWMPSFFYVGCRYVQVHCVPSHPGGPLPRVRDLSGIVVHSSSESAGSFLCSDDLFNRIFTLVRWAQRNNMVSLMTDCPTRERLGWLEQDHLNGPALRYDFDLARLFTKQTHDMADEQTADGLVPSIAPEYAHFKGAFRDSPEWGSAAILVPWQQYQFDGDLELLREHYDMMAHYVAYLGSTAGTNKILSHGLGDWYDIGPKAPGVAQLTPIALTATAFYYEDSKVLSQIATLLAKTNDAAHYLALSEQIAGDFNKTFFHPDRGWYSTGSQTANAIPWVMGLCPATNRPSVLQAIVDDVHAHDNSLTAGDVGYRYLLCALAGGGRSDVIYEMNHQSEKPGYGYQIKKGATSLTEAWNARSGSSQDHFMLGQIQEWFYHDLAGIQDADDSPGFKHFIIAPSPVGDITWAKAVFHSIRGDIACDWKTKTGRFRLNVSVPPGTTATILIPAKSADQVTESRHPILTDDGVTFLRMENGRAVLNLESGDYHFWSED